VVDVGCGLGGFLLSMQAAGAEPTGVEISREARDFVRQQLGMPVYGDLAECLVETGSTDAIVLTDVVEHLVDPIGLLETALKGLRPGGVLVIWTPNGGAAGANLASASDWVGFRVDLEHLQYLSARTIVLLAERLGLTVEHLETTGFPGLAGIGREPKRSSWFRRRMQEARTAVALSPAGPIAKSFRATLSHRSELEERTTGSYHLFAVLKNGWGQAVQRSSSSGDL
jgi:SAM-dependent methyltransferase